MKVARVVLVGFMGAGKSTVGPLLAARLGFQFIDADQHLEQEAGLSVAEIFETRGESAFRRMEAETIRRLMELSDLVLALGGGALEAQTTRQLLHNKPGTCIVFLEAPVETLLTRCDQPSVATAPVRPLFAALRNDRARLEEKLTSRLEHYRAANLTIAASDLTPSEVAEAIVDRLPGLQLAVNSAPRIKPQHPEGIW